MAWYDTDIDIQIIDQTFPMALPGLSIPVLLDFTPGGKYPDKVIQYNSIDAVGADWDVTSVPYRMANRVFSAQPHVNAFQVFNFSRFNYKKATLKTGDPATDSGLIWTAQEYGAVGDSITVELRDPATSGATLSVSVSDSAITVSLATDSAGNIISTASDVRTAVNADSAASALVLVSLDPDNAAPGTGSGVVSAMAATNLNRLNTPDSPAELTRALNAMWSYVYENELPHPYFLLCPSRDYDNGVDVAGVAGDREELADAVTSRLMFYMTGNRGTSKTDSGLESPSTLHTLATQMATDRAALFWHDQSEAIFPEAQLLSLWGATDPGRITLKWRSAVQLPGIPAAQVSDNDVAQLRGQAPGAPGAFTYAKVFGSPAITGSWDTLGSFCDWRRDKDWLRIRLQARTIDLLRNGQPGFLKVLFDDRGVAALVNAWSEVFALATSMGIIAIDDGIPQWKILTIPLKDHPQIERQNRKYVGSMAAITPAGAIEEVKFPVYATFADLSLFEMAFVRTEVA